MISQSNFHSIPKQAKRLEERNGAQPFVVEICGMEITVDPGVYQTSGDSELMIQSVAITKQQNFLEVGCGSGAVSIAVAKKAHGGVGVDINERAVANSIKNAKQEGVENVEFLVSDVFEKVEGMFDVIICNPPYTKHDARDAVDRMFWDPEDLMKKRFFKEVEKYLKPQGRIYFGWANFADIDVSLPFTLAQEHGYKLLHTYSKPHRTDFTFYVFEFVKKPQ